LLSNLIERVFQDALKQIVNKLTKSDENLSVQVDHRNIILLKAVGQMLEHAIEIEENIIESRSWILPGVISFLELKYQPIMFEAIEGCFKLLTQILINSQQDNITALLEGIQPALTHLSVCNKTFREHIDSHLSCIFDDSIEVEMRQALLKAIIKTMPSSFKTMHRSTLQQMRSKAPDEPTDASSLESMIKAYKSDAISSEELESNIQALMSIESKTNS
jgi:hypothetical protein